MAEALAGQPYPFSNTSIANATLLFGVVKNQPGLGSLHSATITSFENIYGMDDIVRGVLSVPRDPGRKT